MFLFPPPFAADCYLMSGEGQTRSYYCFFELEQFIFLKIITHMHTLMYLLLFKLTSHIQQEMDLILEKQRQLHEEIDRLVKDGAATVQYKFPTAKSKTNAQHLQRLLAEASILYNKTSLFSMVLLLFFFLYFVFVYQYRLLTIFLSICIFLSPLFIVIICLLSFNQRLLTYFSSSIKYTIPVDMLTYIPTKPYD